MGHTCVGCGLIFNRRNLKHKCTVENPTFVFIERRTGVTGAAARNMLMNFIKYEQNNHWVYVRSEEDEPESPVPSGLRSVVVKVTEPMSVPGVRKRKRQMSSPPPPLFECEEDDMQLVEPPRKIQRQSILEKDLECSPSSISSWESEGPRNSKKDKEIEIAKVPEKENEKQRNERTPEMEKNKKSVENGKDKEKNEKIVENGKEKGKSDKTIENGKETDKNEKIVENGKQKDKNEKTVEKGNEKERKEKTKENGKEKHINEKTVEKGKGNEQGKEKEKESTEKTVENRKENRIEKTVVNEKVKELVKGNENELGKEKEKDRTDKTVGNRKEKDRNEKTTVAKELVKENEKDRKGKIDNRASRTVGKGNSSEQKDQKEKRTERCEKKGTDNGKANESSKRKDNKDENNNNMNTKKQKISINEYRSRKDKVDQVPFIDNILKDIETTHTITRIHSPVRESTPPPPPSPLPPSPISVIGDDEIQRAVASICVENDKCIEDYINETLVNICENVDENKECEGLAMPEERMTRKEEEKQRKEERRLRVEKEKEEEEEIFVKERLTHLDMIQRERVLLNVGGFKFETSRHTLRKDPKSLLARLPPGNSVFLDRDGSHFRLILNYLRDDCQMGSPAVLPRERKYLLELKTECKYYNVKGLERIVERRIKQIEGLYGME